MERRQRHRRSDTRRARRSGRSDGRVRDLATEAPHLRRSGNAASLVDGDSSPDSPMVAARQSSAATATMHTGVDGTSSPAWVTPRGVTEILDNHGHPEYEYSSAPLSQGQVPSGLWNTTGGHTEIGNNIEMADANANAHVPFAARLTGDNLDQMWYAGDGNELYDTLVSGQPSVTSTMLAECGSYGKLPGEDSPLRLVVIAETRRAATEVYLQDDHPRLPGFIVDDPARIQAVLQQASLLRNPCAQGVALHDGYLYPQQVTEDQEGFEVAVVKE